jgi:uncharacterized protein with GYD domain
MAMYVTLFKYTGPIKGGGPERFKKVQEIVAAENGKIHSVYGLLGAWDVVSIGEFSDTATAMRAVAKIGNLIGAQSHTMPAVERDEFLNLLAGL